MADIEKRLNAILKQTAQTLNIEDFSVNLNLGGDSTRGFMGTIYKASLLDKTTNNTTKVFIKAAPEDPKRRDEVGVEDAYHNEIVWYTMILPAFKKFQKERGISDIFDPVPRYLASDAEKYKEMLALEDISFLGYQTWQRDLLLDEEHMRTIFGTYGKLHALSFCLRDQKPGEYAKLAKLCRNVMVGMKDKFNFSYTLKAIAAKSFRALDPNLDGPVREKYQKYVDEALEIFGETAKYEGGYSTILHGDCWSNNVLFNYKNPEEKSGLQSINLVDFQFIWIGTPVFDLSYFFYSSGSKSLFQKLESLLDVYYDSFSRFAKALGSDPQKMYPREVLASDWQQYSKFGMLMSLFLVQIKLMSKIDSAEVAKMIGNGRKAITEKFVNSSSVNEKLFYERIRDILLHMYEMDAL